MKKYIAIFLIICMVMPSMLVFGASAATNEEQVDEEPIIVSENVKMLDALGILDEAFFTKPADQLVTRGEFAYILSKIDNYPMTYTESSYTDVKADNPYLSEIEQAKRKGLIEDYVDGKFRPDSKVTYETVLRALIDVTGHKEYAAVKGYDFLANRLGINKNVKVKNSDGVTFEQTATLVVNTLRAPLLEIYAVNSLGGIETTYDKHENLLERNFDIYRTEGIVDATYISSMNLAVSKANAGCFTVDGLGYEQGEIDIAMLLGYKLDFYYKYDDASNKRTALYILPIENDNDIIKISAEDVEVPSGDTLYYYVKNKRKSFKLKNTTNIVLNGRWVSGTRSSNIFDMDGGNVSIVDNGNETFVSVINAKEYYVTYVGKTGNDINITTASGSIDFSELNDEAVFKIEKDGKVVGAKEISKGDVFEIVTDALDDKGVMNYEDAMYIGGKITKQQIEGDITTLSDGSVGITVEEGMVDYDYSKAFKRLLEKGKVKDFNLGTTCFINLNSSGEISYYEKGASLGEEFGIVLNYGTTHESFDDTVLVEILETDGKAKIYTLPEKLTIDGKKRKAETFITRFESLTNDILNSEGNKDPRIEPELRMIRYQKNEDGEIRMIDTCKTDAAPDELMMSDPAYEGYTPVYGEEMTCTYEIKLGAKSHRLESGIMGDRFILATGSPYFVLPRAIKYNNTDDMNNDNRTNPTRVATNVDVDDEENYMVGSTAYKQQGNSGVWFSGVYSYMRDEDGLARATSVYSKTGGGSGRIDLSGSLSFGLITNVIQACNEKDDGAPCTAIVTNNCAGISDRKAFIKDDDMSILQSEKKDPNGEYPIAKVGDIIRYAVDDEDYLRGVEVVITAEEMKAGLPKISTDVNGNPIPFQDEHRTRISYGMIYNVGASTILMSTEFDDERNDYKFGPEDMVVFRSSVGVDVLEYNRHGEPILTPTSWGSVRTAKEQGSGGADKVIIISNNKAVYKALVVRIFD